MEWLKRLERFYKKSQRTILYVDLIFILIVFYLRQYFEGIWIQLIPAATIGAFAILIEALFSINEKIKKDSDIQEYRSVSEIMTKILTIIQDENKKKHEIKVIGTSGGTAANVMVQYIIDKAQEPYDVTFLIVDPNSNQARYFPDHWIAESQATINRVATIGATKQKNILLKCYTYNYVPCVNGMLIDGNHLFLSYVTWETGGKLSGQYHPHIYYYRSPRTETHFRIFETWFENAPKNNVWPMDQKPA